MTTSEEGNFRIIISSFHHIPKHQFFRGQRKSCSRHKTFIAAQKAFSRYKICFATNFFQKGSGPSAQAHLAFSNQLRIDPELIPNRPLDIRCYSSLVLVTTPRLRCFKENFFSWPLCVRYCFFTPLRGANWSVARAWGSPRLTFVFGRVFVLDPLCPWIRRRAAV